MRLAQAINDLYTLKKDLENKSDMHVKDAVAGLAKILPVLESASREKDSTYTKVIEFAMKTEEADSFLELWLHGDFDCIRRDWPDAPEEIYPPDISEE